MAKKIIPINYTDRDYSSIRQSLLQHAKRYYPNSYKDFNEASFGSLMIDTVAYVGDVMSFYLDYQANESFLDTAAEYDNVVKLSRAMGYKFNKAPSSYGVCQFFCLVPAVPNTAEPNLNYLPVIKRGSQVSSDTGAVFTLLDDVRFTVATSEFVVAQVDETNGTPTYYAVKSDGRVVSGVTKTYTQTVGAFQRFLKVEVPGENISEILSVIDSDGNEFAQVDDLTQEVVYVPVTNPGFTSDRIPNLLKTVTVPRRYTVENNRASTILQFGHGSPIQDLSGSIADPSSVVLKRHARPHISDATFDPSKLTSNDKLGIAPANTVLSISYRENTQEFVNAAAGSVKNKTSILAEFDNLTILNKSVRDYVTNGIEVLNEEPIVGDISLPTVDEIKIRALGAFSSQGRAVTKQDYINLTYAMPSNFGAIKRCTIIRDADSFKRNLNLYVLSEDTEGKLAVSNRTLKNNLKTWLNGARMISDTIDILDPFIVNYGVEYEIIVKRDQNKFDALSAANLELKNLFTVKKEIGEPIYISEYYEALKKVPQVLDVISIKVVNKNGYPYSGVSFSIERNTSLDGRVITLPETHIFELKYPNRDIKGSVV
ncbi:hypothetical protein N9989_00145 [bacterium]|nr:hypothetical protein [bacterium]